MTTYGECFDAAAHKERGEAGLEVQSRDKPWTFPLAHMVFPK